jgi:flagellar hook-basal body complex protein FliE
VNDFIAPLVAIQEPSAAAFVVEPAASAATRTSFGTMVAGGLRHVSEQLHVGEADLQKLATGQAENLHQVMLRLEESRVSFQLMLQVRNRLLESYQEVMRMQL